MVADKTVRTKWYGQNGIVGIRTKWYRQNGTILYFMYILIKLNSNCIQYIFSDPKVTNK